MGKPFQKGNPGKPKGAVCRFTTLKYAFLEAFDKTGGVDGLVKWIQASNGNRSDFYRLVARMLPADVNIGNTPDAEGKGQELLIKVVHVNGGDGGNGNGNGNGTPK